MKINTFEELLIHELRDLYDAEQRITKALPKMIKAANSPELKSALQDHLEVTKTHVGRLEEAFGELGQSVKGENSKGLSALLDQGDALIDEKSDAAVRDAGLITAAQKVEHYEIAAYGSVCAWAKTLGRERLADMLGRTLDEEKEADKLLTSIAVSKINAQAEEHMLRA